ncbi:hypothetical protein PPGU19_091660 (plasmid) [Paraburkholderia sp. PGU19]|uniref:YecA/YgfB family protein n=1 Tax=Paraburkholderia sp. PGU19 TaxID=2735434 RepID=UPI0015DB4412|nr:YecA family protein [Paraburkholderia sp. PGU19]BCG04598.1 hypothetical protein PPGU19_091660 [Paraburkholderia sp. PGU19]
MNLDPESDEPLTDEEFDVLERFLSSNAVCDDAMDAIMLHGFLTAIISGPNMVMPSAILPWVWDARHATRQPRFLSAGRARKMTGLIIQYWNDINNTLNHCPDLFEPPLHTTEWKGEEVLILDEWCEGYCEGIDIDREAWEPLLERHPEWFNVILLFGTASGYRELAQRDYTVAQRRSFANLLTAGALNIHQYWREERRKSMEQGERPNMIAAVSRPKDRTGNHTGRSELDAQDGNGSEDLFLVDSLGRTTEDAFHPLALSPLSTRITREGTSVEVHIYRAENDSRDGWVLEIIDSLGTSTVWDDLFPTDGAALDEALNTISSHGIASVTGGVPEHMTKH